MELTKHNVQLYLEDYSSKIDKFVKSEIVDINVFQELLTEFDKISSFLVCDKDTPEVVLNFLSDEYLNPEIKLPDKFSKLSSIFLFRDFIKSYSDKQIKTALKNKDYNKVISIINSAVQADIRNVVMVEQIVDLYKQYNLHNRLIELYRMMFVYTLEPLYFEKIGDVYAAIEKYQEALDSYLNCAEYTEDYAQIYDKLADIFGKVNDNDSRLACLNQAKLIRGANDK